MPTRRKSAAAIRSQQTRFLIFFGAVVALVVLTVVTILPAVGPAEDLPLCVEDQDPAQFQELQQLRPKAMGGRRAWLPPTVLKPTTDGTKPPQAYL